MASSIAPSPDSPYPHLLSGLQLGSHQLRNRIAFASVFSGLSKAGDVTPEMIDFYTNRARGGAALVVTEAFIMWRRAASFAQARVYGQEDMRRFRDLAASVKGEGAILMGQITEQGRGDMRAQRRPEAVAPSSLPDDLSWTMPYAMSVVEVRDMIADMVHSAAHLQACGFDGIEISGGHGHIFHQFMSPWMNRREDEFGGAFENRMRLIDELVAGLRAECGADFLVGLRLPGSDGLEGSLGWSDAADITAHFTRDRQVDYVNHVQGAHAWTLFQHLPDMHGPRGPYVEEVAKLRASANGVAVAATGRIVEPAQAEILLAQGKADFVLLGRTLIADPAWGLKASQNRDNDIRKCVSCNNCWAISTAGHPTWCDNNPRVGLKDEADWWPSPVAQRRRVVIVGSGIAGLEAAWVAAARGHEVTLFGGSSEAGGRARLFSRLPGCDAISSIYDYQLTAAQKAGVRFKLSHHASIDDVAAVAPDAVILATGGDMHWPNQLPLELRDEGFIPDLHSLLSDIVDRPTPMGGTAVLYDFDGTEMTYAAAELFADMFDRVVILTPVEAIARDESTVKKQSIYRRLMERDVEILPWSVPSAASRFEDGVFVYRNVMTGRERQIEDVALFTYATVRSPRQALLAPLLEICRDVRLVGDAKVARSTIRAVRDGHFAGLEV